MTANFTYSWKPVNNTNFAVCIVVASNELDTKVKPVYLQLASKLVSEISSEGKFALALAAFVNSVAIRHEFVSLKSSTRFYLA